MLVKVRECCCDLPSSEVPTYYPTTAKSSECGKLAEFCKKIGRFSDFGNFASLCREWGKGLGSEKRDFYASFVRGKVRKKLKRTACSRTIFIKAAVRVSYVSGFIN